MSGNLQRFRLVTDQLDVQGWAGDADPRFRSAQLEIGGADITGAVKAVSYRAEPGHLPELTIELIIAESEIDSEAALHLPEQTRAALIALGWTPPQH